MKDGRFSVTTDCNGGGGRYINKNQTLLLGEIAVTEMACFGDIQEAEFYSMLRAVESYEVTDTGNLLLSTAQMEMVFTPMAFD